MSRGEKRRLAWEAILGRSPRKRGGSRPFLGVRFDCCGVYARIYRNRDQTAYVGRCPHCLRALAIRISAEGTGDRFFRAW